MSVGAIESARPHGLAGRWGLRTADAMEAGQARAPLPVGIAAIDALLGGGLPRGRIVEIACERGQAGRLSLVLAALATTSRRGELAAFVDAGDRLDPRGLVAAGADPSRVLWIRPPTPRVRDTWREAMRAADVVLDAGGFGLLVVDLVEGGDAPGAASWARLARRSEQAGTAVVASTPARNAGSFAAASLVVVRERPRFERAPGARCVLGGAELSVRLAHSKLPRARATEGGVTSPILLTTVAL